MAWLLLVGAITFEVTGTLSLRASDGFTKLGWVFPVVTGYLASFVLLGLVLKRGIPVGVAYGVWSALGVVATAVLARYLFGDPLTWIMGSGVALIGAGVVLLELGAGRHLPHP
jgi:small multidrug resistance pump